MYFSGQGKIFLSKRDGSGNKLAERYVGKTANGAKVGLATTTQTRKEAESGQRLTAARYITEKNATLEFELEDFNKENLAFLLWGAAATIAAGTVTAEAFPTGLVADDYYSTKKAKISSLVMKDSNATPATLTLGTHYTLEDANTGLIKIVNVGSFTQPFKADYSNAASYNIPMFGIVPGEWWFTFRGLNTQDSNEPVIVELYKVAIDPLAELFLKSEDIATYKVSGSALYDDTKTADTELGVFGRVRTLK